MVFRLSPVPGTRKWTYSVLYNFCSRDSGCSDGQFPASGLSYVGALSGVAYDGTSPLYGTTLDGGKNFFGTVFSLNPRTNGTWFVRTLYAFCAQTGCADGGLPNAVVADASGNLYGTARSNASGEFFGMAFKLVPGTRGCCWNETVLHAFCSQPACADGWQPLGATVDAAGNLFGATLVGGTPGCGNNNGCGVAYKIAPDTTFTVLHAFCSLPNCKDGSGPVGNLLLDSSGNLYGLARADGMHDGGTAFELTSGGGFLVLHAFCRDIGCLEGRTPQGGLISDPLGNLYGVAAQGGDLDVGTAYRITP